jgi:hypothetical protein
VSARFDGHALPLNVTTMKITGLLSSLRGLCRRGRSPFKFICSGSLLVFVVGVSGGITYPLGGKRDIIFARLSPSKKRHVRVGRGREMSGRWEYIRVSFLETIFARPAAANAALNIATLQRPHDDDSVRGVEAFDV